MDCLFLTYSDVLYVSVPIPVRSFYSSASRVIDTAERLREVTPIYASLSCVIDTAQQFREAKCCLPLILMRHDAAERLRELFSFMIIIITIRYDDSMSSCLSLKDERCSGEYHHQHASQQPRGDDEKAELGCFPDTSLSSYP